MCELGVLRKLREFFLVQPGAVGGFKRVELVLGRIGLGAVTGHRGGVRGAFLDGRDRHFPLEGRRRVKRLHRIIILLAERLEFMVVTSRASERDAQEHGCGGVDGVVQGVEAALRLVRRVHHVGAQKVEGGGGDRPRIVGRQFVSGDLFADEAVVGFVAVKGVDHVIAIAPRMRAQGVMFESVAFGVAHEIQPVTGPAFAVVRRGEQTVDEPFVSLWRTILNENVDVLRRGRQADEIERHAADELLFRGGSCGLEMFGLQVGEDELVDRIGGPGFLAGGRGIDVGDRLERPMCSRIGGGEIQGGPSGSEAAPREKASRV